MLHLQCCLQVDKQYDVAICGDVFFFCSFIHLLNYLWCSAWLSAQHGAGHTGTIQSLDMCPINSTIVSCSLRCSVQHPSHSMLAVFSVLSRLWEGRELCGRHEQQCDEGYGRQIFVPALHAEQDVSGSILYALGNLLPADELQKALHYSFESLYAHRL